METNSRLAMENPEKRILELEKQVEDLQRELSKSEDKFREIIDNAPVGLFLDSAEGHATYINDKCAELIGVPAENALEYNWANYLHPDDLEMVTKEWGKAFKNNDAFKEKYRYVHDNGDVVWTLGEVNPILDEQGNAKLFVGALTDITALKQSEAEHQQLATQLVQAQKMESIGRLAGGIAHDYNNMLGIIIGYAELAMTEVDESQSLHKPLSKILNSAMRSADITKKLLSFARKQTISPEPIDMSVKVGEMLGMLRHLIGENIKLEWLPGAHDASIMMDPSQLDQIVVNLCINSRDAIQGVGKITIETYQKTITEIDAQASTDMTAGEYHVLSITDTGCGMDESVLGNIFEPFFTTKAKGAGTGLGLASVYGAVRQSDGFIDVKSEPNVGTKFEIFIPIFHGDFDESQRKDPISAHSGKNKTLILVDDESSILEAVSMILESLGYKVLVANSFKGALELSSHYDDVIDLVMTDLVMPEGNGRDLAECLLKQRAEIKVLYMSGYNPDILGTKGVLGEKVHFIQKPFTRAQLMAKLEVMLD